MAESLSFSKMSRAGTRPHGIAFAMDALRAHERLACRSHRIITIPAGAWIKSEGATE